SDGNRNRWGADENIARTDLLGHPHHHGSQPCAVRRARRGWSLGTSKGGYAGWLGGRGGCAGGDGDSLRSRGRPRMQGGTLFECARRRSGLEPDSGSRPSYRKGSSSANGGDLV